MLDPDGAVVFGLQQLGAPVLMVTLVATALAIAGWVEAGIATHRHGTNAVTWISRVFVERTSRRARFAMGYLLTAIPLAALLPVAVRLDAVYFAQVGTNWEPWGWLTVLMEPDSLLLWCVVAVGVSLVLFALGLLGRARFLFVLLGVGWALPLLALLGMGAVWAIALLGYSIGVLAAFDDGAQTWPYAIPFVAMAVSNLGSVFLVVAIVNLGNAAFEPESRGD